MYGGRTRMCVGVHVYVRRSSGGALLYVGVRLCLQGSSMSLMIPGPYLHCAACMHTSAACSASGAPPQL